MNPISFAIRNPVTILVGVIFVVIFGLISLLGMPYQLTPTVIEPEISVQTVWSGATPYEIERDIIEEQENVLKGIPGLVEMESESFSSFGRINLRFSLGTNVDDALLRVSNKLNEVRSYPQGADRPVITATGAASSPIIFTSLRTLPDNPKDIDTYRTFFENEVRQDLERVEGVADLFVFGGTEREMHVVVLPERLAAYGMTLSEVIRALQAENVNVAAGSIDVGRRDYRIRTVAEFQSPEEIEALPVRSSGQERVFLRDVGHAEFGYEKASAAMLHRGEKGITVGIQAEPGTNVLELTDAVEAVVRHLNQTVLEPQGLVLLWLSDQRDYIQGAISLVQQNILIGGLLAMIVLFIFLRRISTTGIAAGAIPISIIGTFIFMSAFGRNLNVVSLAGISFAVGMLVDSTIVVLENIDRHLKMRKPTCQAALDGTREVWGAILASALTTVAVFLPVVFIQEEAGQLFKDIAIAVTCAISLSLVVSVMVIPSITCQLFRVVSSVKPRDLGPLPRLGGFLVNMIMFFVRQAVRNWFTRILTVSGLTAAAVLIAWLFFPKMDYLPEGNRNLVLNILIPPPGLSYPERVAIGEQIHERLEPHYDQDVDGFPGILHLFYVGAESFMFFGAVSTHEQRAGELIPLFRNVIGSIPGMLGVSLQAGIFQTRLGRGRTIDIDIVGPNLEELVAVGGTMFGMLRGIYPGAQVRPIPSLELTYPEIRFIPDRDRLRAAGLSATDLGLALDVLTHGRKIGDFKEEGQKTIDLVLRSSVQAMETPEVLHHALVATPQGISLPVSSLAAMERTTGITQIRHLERQRTVTLQLTPPEDVTLQEAMETVQNQVVPALEAQGLLGNSRVEMSGVADKLTETRLALQWNFILAVIIIYLLMSALFGNFVYPLIILFTVPLATAGGFVGLKLVNVFIAPQPLDILTMLGFVILVGVVVNNAILLVNQSLINVRQHGMEHLEGVLEATRVRLRPIYMSTTTSIFGMLPLVVAPGPGSELYRGLGSVVLGGLALSTVFTIFVIPSLLAFFIRMETPGSAMGADDPLGGAERCELPESEKGANNEKLSEGTVV
ncbi:efflux RND transporter permease subunit [Desulfonatronum lacustre]|uniref:efflux RND transporter permease subunit n=1 Tax=Desulfonatronum lacustre TaxID=66849 RepID=UPI0004B71383|nr:efflux RND transporter permease subunit [Desulfonatronum lacustre]